MKYLTTKQIEKKEYEIDIKYNEFANPSFENQIQILGSAWANGEISTPRYVDLLWGDTLDDEGKLQEIEWLDEHQKELNTNEQMVPDISELANDNQESEEDQEFMPSNNLQ